MPGRLSAHRIQGRTTAVTAACALLLCTSTGSADDVTVTVNADGSFDPPTVEIDDGDT